MPTAGSPSPGAVAWTRTGEVSGASGVAWYARWWWWLVVGLALLAIVRSVWLAVQREPLVEGTDAFWYERLGWNMRQGHGLSLDASAPFNPTMYREPGYAAVIAAIYLLVGRSPSSVVLVQALMLGGIVALVALIGRRAFGPGVALLGAGLVVVSPDQADVARQVLSETPFTLLLFLVVLLGLIARESGRWPLFLGIGVLWGLLSYVRVQGQLLLLVLLPLWLVLDRIQYQRWRLAQLGALAAAAVLVVLPWLARNEAIFGRPVLTQRYSTLLPRAARTTASLEQNVAWAGQALWLATNPYSAVLVPLDRFQFGRRYWENDIWAFHITLTGKIMSWAQDACEAAAVEGPAALDRAIAQLPIDPREDRPSAGWGAKYEDCALDLGTRLVRQHPVAFVLQSPFEWAKLNFYPLPSRLSLFRNSLVWAAFGAMAWLLLRRRQQHAAVWLVAVAVAFNIQALVADATERYAVPILPLYYLLAAAGLVAFGGWLSRCARRGGRRLSREAPS